MRAGVFDQKVGGETLKVEITPDMAISPPSVYSLHGAGPSNRRRADYIADAFAQKGRSVLRFDFSGWGDSTGDRREASLARRLEEALAVARHLDTNAPITLIGTSMGGHVAVRLLKHLNVGHLVLFCPAAYAARAEDMPFDDDFTAVLRQPESWADSPVWEELKVFRGRLSIIIGAEDAIIPGGVLERYLDSGRSADLCFMRLEGAPHNLHDWLGKTPAVREQVLSERLG